MSRCSASRPRYVTGPAHARLSGTATRPPAPHRVPFVVLGEGQDLPRPRPRALVRLGLPGLESAQALGDVGVEAELPLLAVAHHVHARSPPACAPPRPRPRAPVRRSPRRRRAGRAPVPASPPAAPWGARQTAGKRRQSAFGALLHRCFLLGGLGRDPPARRPTLDSRFRGNDVAGGGAYSTRPGAVNRGRVAAVAAVAAQQASTALWGEGVQGAAGRMGAHPSTSSGWRDGGGGWWGAGGPPRRPTLDSRFRGNDGEGGAGMTMGGGLGGCGG